MKKYTKTMVLVITVLSIAITACRKENNATNEQSSNVKGIFAQTQVQSQTFTIDASSYGNITGSKGTKIYYGAGALLHQNGTQVTGSVQIELKEIYSVGDMILSNATTTSNGERLQSGGEVYLRATQGSEALRINHQNPLVISYPTTDPGNSMQLFHGQYIHADSLAQDSVLNWNTTNVQGQVTLDSGTTHSFFEFPLDTFGWSNCDRFYNNTGGTAVKIQSGGVYTNKNTAVFLVFNAEHTVAPADVYDSTSHTFGFHSDGHTPLGLSVTIVAISVINGAYYSSIVPTTTSAGMIVPLTFQPTTLAAFRASVSAL